MSDTRKQKLIDLGAVALAEALIELAGSSERADDLIERLVATPEESVKRFKKKLSGIKRRKRFIDRREAAAFALELKTLLLGVRAGVSDALTALQQVAAFFHLDESVFNLCDDSDGYVGDVFRGDATELFVDYASRCTDKKSVAILVLKVNLEDAYGVRDSLIARAGEYLPEPLIREMISTLQGRVERAQGEYKKRDHLRLIESLARQIKDAQLYQETCLAMWGETSTAALIDIAQVYLESGDAETAHEWIKKFPEEATFQRDERDEVLAEIYRAQGDTENLGEVLYQNFRSSPTVSSLQALLAVIGEDKRDEVLTEEVTSLLKAEGLRLSDAEFLIALGKIDEAETYLLERVDQLDGYRYTLLPPIARAMESEGRALVASMIYRSLLLSILERGYIKAYTHGARHLDKLDTLSESIIDWRESAPHVAFKAQLIQPHGLKRSFWAKYKAHKEK